MNGGVGVPPTRIGMRSEVEDAVRRGPLGVTRPFDRLHRRHQKKIPAPATETRSDIELTVSCERRQKMIKYLPVSDNAIATKPEMHRIRDRRKVDCDVGCGNHGAGRAKG